MPAVALRGMTALALGALFVAAWSTTLGARAVVAASATRAASATSAPSATTRAALAGTPGYRLLGGDGGIFSFSLPFAGSAASNPTYCPPDTTDREMPDGTCWSMATTPSGGGYWILNASTGAIYNYGDAVYYGSPADQLAGVGRDLVPNFIGIASTPDGRGYWVLALGLSGLGSIEHFGDASFYGDEISTAGEAGHVGSPVAVVATPSGRGYWIVDSDGGVFTFGDAGFYGSMGAKHLNAPIVGMAVTPDGRGYWLVAADGGVFSFGDAAFGGSMAGVRLNAPVVGMAADVAGPGYWLAAADGGVFALGGAPFEGSMGGKLLAQPIFAISS